MIKLYKEGNKYYIQDDVCCPFDTAQEAFDFIERFYPGLTVEVSILH